MHFFPLLQVSLCLCFRTVDTTSALYRLKKNSWFHGRNENTLLQSKKKEFASPARRYIQCVQGIIHRLSRFFSSVTFQNLGGRRTKNSVKCCRGFKDRKLLFPSCRGASASPFPASSLHCEKLHLRSIYIYIYKVSCMWVMWLCAVKFCVSPLPQMYNLLCSNVQCVRVWP